MSHQLEKDFVLLVEQFDATFSFVEIEKKILDFWNKNNIYKKIQEQNQQYPDYVFTDGPPFCSSEKLHMGHLLISFMKSCTINFWNMHGKNVLNKLGYDVHGLPLEMVVSKELNLNTNDEIKEYGINNYNNKCKETINKFSGAWKPIFKRIGRFSDFSNEYKTMDLNFMETVWWVWNEFWKQGLIYKGYRIMPYSTACGTSISASEASGDDVYKMINSPAIYVKFKLNNTQNTFFVAWTTTPWTLPSNLALIMNPTITYVTIWDIKTNEYYILSENCLYNLYNISKKKQKNTNLNTFCQIIEKHPGSHYNNQKYEPLFDYFINNRTFYVLMGDFVEDGSGTGVVHCAPGFGEDDFNICIEKNVVDTETVGKYCPVDANGRFTSPVDDEGLFGVNVIETNPIIIKLLKQRNCVIRSESYMHRYPHCWRTDTPLIYRVVPSFFIRVTSLRSKLLENNEKVNWIPERVGQVQFKNWLNNVRDWGVSRTRFFGNPLPVWISDDGKEMISVGSIDELVKLAGLNEQERPTDLHLDKITDIEIPSKQGKGMLKLCNDVFDCWFESGCVPYGQLHYPFENGDYFDNREYISDFITEGAEQTRGWFYTLTVIAAALFDKPAFKNVICNGLVLADDGKKFSKRLGNFTSPIELCNEHGADPLRMYLVTSRAAHAESLYFNDKHIKEISGKYYQFYNANKFFLEHLIKFQKDGNKFDITAYKKSENVMDQWILSRTRTFMLTVENEMFNYRIYQLRLKLNMYIEDLINWYVKLNRNRLKGLYCNTLEQNEALSTLLKVLFESIKIIAPFAPFLTEYIYQQLKVIINDSKESIHLYTYPKADEFVLNTVVEDTMKNLQTIVKMVRIVRTKTPTLSSVLVPLKKIIIFFPDKNFTDQLQKLEGHFHEDINAMQIEYSNTYAKINYQIKLDSSKIGRRYRKKAPKIKEYLNNLSTETLEQYLDDKQDHIDVDFYGKIITITDEYFTIQKMYELVYGENDMCIADGDITIIVDTEQTDQTRQLYAKRLFTSHVQSLRKKTNLHPWDAIKIYYTTESNFICDAITKYKDDIEKQLLNNVYNRVNKSNEKVIGSEDYNILDHMVKIVITENTV